MSLESPKAEWSPLARLIVLLVIFVEPLRRGVWLGLKIVCWFVMSNR